MRAGFGSGGPGPRLSADPTWTVVSALALCGALLSCPVWAQGTMTRVSVGPLGVQGNEGSGTATVSNDGRFVVFESSASTLVVGDTNSTVDVFLHDRVTGDTIRVSVGPGGVEANGPSYRSEISADGQFVVFTSHATNLVSGDTNLDSDVFVHDRVTSTTERVSVGPLGVQGNGLSGDAAISADGRFVAFHSWANNLVAGDKNDDHGIFVHDRVTGITERVSVGPGGVEANGNSTQPAISADGRFVAFHSSASNLVNDDTNAEWDVFVHDRVTGTTERVSVGPLGVQGNGLTGDAAISADGQFVVFTSWATNLVPGDTNGYPDVFVHDCVTSTTTRISVGLGGVQSNLASFTPAVSADGRFVAFVSSATNLVAGDMNHALDVFVYDRLNATTALVSVGPGGVQGDRNSDAPAVSANGRFVGFTSLATNLVPSDTNECADAFLHDRGPLEPSPQTLTVSVSGTGSGTVTSSPAGINCGADCSETYPSATVVTLAATPAAGHFFGGWSGACTGAGECRVTMTEALNVSAAFSAPTDDEDGDGISNETEALNGTDPAAAQLYFAEGSLTGVGVGRFETRFSIFNPNPVLSVQVTLRFQVEGGGEITDTLLLGPLERRSIDTSFAYPALQMYSGFSTVIEGRLVGTTTGAKYNIVADRTMTWQRGGLHDAYGSHAETAVRQPATQWYLAEGATFGAFRLYYLLQNPNPAAAQVSMQYIFPNAAPCTVGVTVPALSRKTLLVNAELVTGCGRAGTDVSAVITADQKIIVERAMYLDDGPGGRPFFYAGHESAGVLEPQASWRFAEGATGTFFDTYLLVLNQEPIPLDIRLTFLRQGLPNVSVDRQIPANSRNTFALDVLREFGTGNGQSGSYVLPAEGGVSTVVDVLTPDRRVIAERAMWWPGPMSGPTGPGNPQPLWEEAHVSAGATRTSTLWAVADAEAQGEAVTQTYALLSNTSPVATRARVTLAFTDAVGTVTTLVRDFCLAPASRETLEFPSPSLGKYTDTTPSTCGRTAVDNFASAFTDATVRKRFSLTIESLGVDVQPPGELVVERAQYGRDIPASTPGSIVPPWPYWPSGSNNLATPLR